MNKEVLIYSNITDYSAIDFIKSINEIEEGDSLTVRISTDGGSPEYTYGMIKKFQEFEGDKKVKVDGKAYSAGLFFACFCQDVEALNVSQFLVHRAAYPSWFEKSEYFTESLKENLKSINSDMETAFKNKVDVKLFEEIKGVKVKDIFSMDNRLDVFLTAKEAKKIGLISKIVSITPEKVQKINANMVSIAAKYNVNIGEEDLLKEDLEAKSENININKKNTNMDIEKLKQEHPTVFAEALSLGAEKERERVSSWMTFNDVDASAVADGVKSGKEITMSQITDFTVKKVSKDTLAAIQSQNAGVNGNQGEPENNGGKEKTALEILEARIDSELGINSKK